MFAPIQTKILSSVLLSYASCFGRPNKLVHLQLEPHLKPIFEHPFHYGARIDAPEDRRKKHSSAPIHKLELMNFLLGPELISAKANHKLDLIPAG